MIELIQQVGHVKQKVERAISLFGAGQINKEELVYLLGRYLDRWQIADLFDRLGIEV